MILHKFTASDFTLVHNRFIDKYMPSANGEFVKIYLYLLRCSDAEREISLSGIADTFNHTESDVRRALSYWENLHLLSLTYDEDRNITDIAFIEWDTQKEDRQKRLNQYAQEIQEHKKESPASPMPSGGIMDTPPSKMAVSASRKKELAQQEDIRQLLYIAEQYMAKNLSSTEVNHILYFYDELHFSPDLIEYLIEYCVSKGKRHIGYIRTVALEWASRGVTTVSEAKKDTNLYHRDYYAVLNAFGIQGRGPAQAEVEFMSRWFHEMDFAKDVVLEACNRTITRIHTPSFSYTDSILAAWKEKGVRSLADLRRLDAQTAPAKEKSKKEQEIPKKRAASNKFNNFPQRKYDYEQLEKQLIDC